VGSGVEIVEKKMKSKKKSWQCKKRVENGGDVQRGYRECWFLF
jgi:hypothetical protein